ncbi:phage integrase N-terminal domain-containing protein [uncultured Pseudoteredinibacter sp.]|uniref:phage integrase N-terminal domain-containing protein n=1 Tax=uncultured Pseudoteredinibacter sp. TaxID=1641701 RepID=UPI00262C7216|nr:phage integrase N-terminal domain-containing protein [uncultured Pseudoteredinibacter sp.]
MRNLNYGLKQLCKHNRDGSYATQSDRHKILQKVANDLHHLGYRGMSPTSLKQKHVQALVSYYKEQELSVGTIKNRLSTLRWWSEKINKPQVVAKENTFYKLGKRELITKTSKARLLDQDKLSLITDKYTRMSLELQAAFGLRREESIKFEPTYADRGDHIQLKSSWCKGGRARIIPIRNYHQREILNQAHELAGKGSLIPASWKYVQQLRCYERQTEKAGLSKMHGLRHAYAQARYEELTGWLAPACGGPTNQQLTAEQRKTDLKARLEISLELGHGREQITAAYLGR